MNGYAARLALLSGLEATHKWAMLKTGLPYEVTCKLKL